ncbi:hypothetical protein ACOMHN_064270 [Nucella lapillus]
MVRGSVQNRQGTGYSVSHERVCEMGWIHDREQQCVSAVSQRIKDFTWLEVDQRLPHGPSSSEGFQQQQAEPARENGYPATRGTPQPSGQGRADRRRELPCDDTVTQAARLASAEGNHASDDRCPSPRETRAETDRQPGHRGSDRGQETYVPNSGVSLIDQPGNGAEGGDVMALHRDVTGLASGSQIGKPPRGAEIELRRDQSDGGLRMPPQDSRNGQAAGQPPQDSRNGQAAGQPPQDSRNGQAAGQPPQDSRNGQAAGQPPQDSRNGQAAGQPPQDSRNGQAAGQPPQDSRNGQAAGQTTATARRTDITSDSGETNTATQPPLVSPHMDTLPSTVT